MMVLDASAAVFALLDDGNARSVLRGDALVCPHLADAEVANALRGRVLGGAVELADATRAIETWARLGIARVSPGVWPGASGSDATLSARTTPRTSPSPRRWTFPC